MLTDQFSGQSQAVAKLFSSYKLSGLVRPYFGKLAKVSLFFLLEVVAKTVLTVLRVLATLRSEKVCIDLDQEFDRLKQASVEALRRRYAEVFGEYPPRTGNKISLLRRILWRLQALEEGDLSQRAQKQAALLANDADLRLVPPKAPQSNSLPSQERPNDPRLPKLGTVLNRRYKGKVHQVQVLADRFVYQDTTYPSLSAVAKAITGTHCNGFLFFRLTPKEKRRGQNR
jgi:hypothetical protein